MTETFRLVRTFTAPVALVWEVWTDPAHVAHWYGPGVETVLHAFDLRPGGRWLTEMKMGGNSMYQRADFVEIIPEGRLVADQMTTDANWHPIANPMMPDWPERLRLSVDFAVSDAGTKMVLEWAPHNATPTEAATFAQTMARMGGGWSMGMDIVDEILAGLPR